MLICQWILQKKEHRHFRGSEVGRVMTPNYNLIIDLSSNTSYVPMSVYTKKYESLLTRATVENPHPYSKPSDATSSYLRYTPRTPHVMMTMHTT